MINRANTIVCQGDSLTDPTQNMGPEWTRWTEVLRRRLESSGANVVVCNIGQSGAKTDDLGKGMLNRLNPFLRGTPNIGIIWGGTNDIRSVVSITRSGSTATATVTTHGYANTALVTITGCDQAAYNGQHEISNVAANTFDFTVTGTPATPATGTTKRACLDTRRNIRAMIRYMQFGCLGVYRSQDSLPADGKDGDRYVVLYDTSTTGGRAAINSTQMATVTGTVDSAMPTAWEYRAGLAGESGWGRVGVTGTLPTHTSKFIVVSNHYLNYSSGGDALDTPYPNYNDVDGLRSYQEGAASDESAVFVDFYNYLRDLIVSGTETQGSYSWHIADQNVHLSQLGHSYLADLLHTTILAQSRWVESIS